jgi:hypothetical protein
MPALSDEELQVVHAAAAMLRPSERCGFLQSVANRFNVTGNLRAALTMALSGYGIAPGPAMLKGVNHAHQTNNR